MEQRGAIAIRFRCHSADLGGSKKLPDERRRFRRYRLSRPGRFSRDRALRNWPLLDREQWMAGKAVKNKDEAHLGYLGDRGNRNAVALHGDEHRLGWQVVVPNIMMHHLVIPEELSG